MKILLISALGEFVKDDSQICPPETQKYVSWENCKREQMTVKKDCLNVILDKKRQRHLRKPGVSAREEGGAECFSASDHVGNLEGNFKALFGVQARITAGEIVAGEFLVDDIMGTTSAFRDVIAGHFKMNPARNGTF